MKDNREVELNVKDEDEDSITLAWCSEKMFKKLIKHPKVVNSYKQRKLDSKKYLSSSQGC